MKKLTISACALLLAGVAPFLGACNDSTPQPGVRFFYKMDKLDPAALDSSDQTMEQPVAEEENIEEYVKRYDANAASRQARPTVAARPAAPKPAAPKLDPPLASAEDIAAAKARVEELRGKCVTAKNGAITGITVDSDQTTLEDMKLFGRLADLENFFFLGSTFTDEMLQELKDLKKVKSATVQNADITVETLKMFATYPELQTLDIRRDLKIENGDLAVIAEFPKLERLNAYYNSFTNSGVNKISKSQTLKVVDLRGCADISDSAAKYLARMPELEEVYFRFGVSDDGVKNLAAAPKLKFVEFQDCDITNACVESLAEFPALKGLRVFRSKGFTNEGIQALASLKLERLELRDLSASDEGVAALQAMDSLREVELSEMAISTEALNALFTSPNWANIETLNLFAVPVTDDNVAAIANNMKNLKNLRVRASGGKNSDATIDSITKIDSLVSLDIRENTGISAAAFMKLASMKNLRKIYVKDTKFGESGDDVVKMREEFKKQNPKCQIVTEG